MSWAKSLGSAVKELRFVVCQTSDRSAGVRNFVAKNYWSLKNANPTFPFIVRECEEVDPYIIVRYRYGIEKKALVSNLNEKEVETVIADLVKDAKSVNTSV